MKNRISWTRFLTTEFTLFLGVWLVYGLTINSHNLEQFGLQQAGVEAIVERHRFSVEDLSSWPVQGDVFGYNGHTHSNKHPGQPMLGAVVYSFLRVIGLDYAKHRLLSAALITFLTASLLGALANVAVFRLAWEFDDRQSKVWAIITSLAFGLGTTSFVYAGIAHHDTIATALLIISFYLVFRLSVDSSQPLSVKIAFAAGLLLGLTITTSMLHFFMVVVVGLYFLSLRRRRLILPFSIGGVLGLVPLLFYDLVNFGNPFILPAIANYKFTGYDPEVFFFPDWHNFIGKLNVYSEFITQYAPILWLGVLGLFFVQARYFREKVVVAAAVIVLLLYVTNVQGLGTCAYGPRYLLPLMPFASVGLIGLRRLPSVVWRLVGTSIVVVVGTISLVVNLVGAIHGAMYCNLAKYAFPDYLSAIMRGELHSFPLAPWLAPFAALFVGVVLWTTKSMWGDLWEDIVSRVKAQRHTEAV